MPLFSPCQELLQWGSYTRADGFVVPLNYLKIGTGERPVVSIVTGLHGDELTANFLLQRYLSYKNAASSATLKIYTAINREGLKVRTRFFPETSNDPNRGFEQDPQVFPQVNVIDALGKSVEDSDLIIDIHNWDTPTAIVGVLAIKHDDRAQAALRRFGCDFIWTIDTKNDQEFSNTFVWWAARRGIPYCALELPDQALLTEEILADLGNRLQRMLAFSAVGSCSCKIGVRRLVEAKAEGLFLPRTTAGAEVQKDEILGSIFSVEDFSLKEEVRSPFKGIILHQVGYNYVCLEDIILVIGIEID